jgi:hypothetical protein
MRRGVPQLLALNRRPFLYDPLTVSAQGLAAQDVTHVLSSDPATRTALGEVLANSTPIAELELSTFEREAALRQPLPPGRTILWLDSRPYRYRPLADAAILEPDTPMVFEAFLDPGHYEFLCEAFAPSHGELTTRVDLPGAKVQRDALETLAYRPIVYSFEVFGDEPRHVTLTLLARIEEGRPPRVGFIHRAELRRTP